ncbi:MAG TPA: S-methyl-5'-thioinosine phosphorylase [Armatimonadota bacterium]|nr:S-methyl-5'-thioinosine phosphorylase [Armatimonadota bacterium]
MTTAIIGGTGVYELGGEATPEFVPTPFGAAAIFRARVGGADTLFLARHGVGHAMPPHRVNYRANIWALHALGVREVLATQAVGSLNPDMPPGSFALLGQFIDWTKGRPATFFDGDDGMVVHVDVTEPYCPRVTAAARHAGAFLGEALHGDAVYACAEGPRFETPAEIRALRLLGADLVGMTNVPEAVLAREAGLCYAAVCIVCNWAAGISPTPLTHAEVLGIMSDRTADLRTLIRRYLAERAAGSCPCAELGFPQYLPAL